jgi:ubiquinone/menaquinone biosynthesis C-methylase UbiE
MYKPTFFALFTVFFVFAVSAENKINAEKPKVYLGRQIAYTMHSAAANWLLRKNREKQESTEEMIKALELKPGMNVADIGCGNGYHSLMMAKLIGNKGKVYCVDIQQKMLDLLKERAKEKEVSNYELILGEFTTPKLPANKVDLILLVDAYHEFTDPVSMLKNMRESLTEKGVIVLSEFRSEDPKVPIKTDHKMSKKQITKEMNANGLKLVRSYDKLPWQHFMAFGKDKKK